LIYAIAFILFILKKIGDMVIIFFNLVYTLPYSVLHTRQSVLKGKETITRELCHCHHRIRPENVGSLVII